MVQPQPYREVLSERSSIDGALHKVDGLDYHDAAKPPMTHPIARITP